MREQLLNEREEPKCVHGEHVNRRPEPCQLLVAVATVRDALGCHGVTAGTRTFEMTRAVPAPTIVREAGEVATQGLDVVHDVEPAAE